uniref:Uncharacterized protein n=1 Tax=Glossina palpalis gambiensis TaxID=67801 RepID=A0A1B0AKR0_9MUSC
MSSSESNTFMHMRNINGSPLLLFKKVKDNIIRTQFINTWRRHRVQCHVDYCRKNDTENNKQPHHSHHHHHQQQQRRHLISIIGYNKSRERVGGLGQKTAVMLMTPIKH